MEAAPNAILRSVALEALSRSVAPVALSRVSRLINR